MTTSKTEGTVCSICSSLLVQSLDKVARKQASPAPWVLKSVFRSVRNLTISSIPVDHEMGSAQAGQGRSSPPADKKKRRKVTHDRVFANEIMLRHFQHWR
jgi:hypothetical protein